LKASPSPTTSGLSSGCTDPGLGRLANLRTRVKAIFAYGRNMNLIVASAFAANIVGQTNNRFLPLYIRELGGSIEDLGVFFSFQTLVTVLLSVVGGWLVDRYNRKLLFTLTPLLMAVGCVLMAAAPSWSWLLPGLSVMLLSSSIGAPIFFSLTSDIAPPERRATYFGYQSMALSLCGLVGPLMGGLFFQYLEYRWFLVFGAVLGLTASYLRSLITDPRDTAEARPGSMSGRGPMENRPARVAADFITNLRGFYLWAVNTPGVARFIVLISLPVLGFNFISTYAGVYLSEVVGFDPAAVGALFTLSGLAMVAANLFGSRLGDHFPKNLVVSSGLAAHGLWALGFTMVTGFPAFALLHLCDGLMAGTRLPASRAWSADICPSDRRGTFRAILSLVGFTMAIPVPLLGAYLWTAAGPSSPFLAAGAVYAAAGLLIRPLDEAR